MGHTKKILKKKKKKKKKTFILSRSRFLKLRLFNQDLAVSRFYRDHRDFRDKSRQIEIFRDICR
jgi:hypothetical protein